MIPNRRCCSTMLLVFGLTMAVIGTAKSHSGTDCMLEYIRLSGIDARSCQNVHALLKKNRIDQSVLNRVHSYADLGRHLAEIGISNAADRFSLYLCAKKGASVGGKCHSSPPCKNGVCLLSGSEFKCSCEAGYSGTSCEKGDVSVGKLEERLEVVEKKIHSVAATYIRWGRADCAGGASAVYSGYTAGTIVPQGSGGNILCMPTNPQYGRYSGHGWGGAIYGARYRSEGKNAPYSNSLNDKYLYCVQCLSPGKSVVTMIPARIDCPAGWHREYHGYLLSPHYTQKRGEYNCFDDQARGRINPSGNHWGHELFRVSVGKPSELPSSYVPARELTCVVCTK